MVALPDGNSQSQPNAPPPLSQHGILPKAWPTNSSCFIYHGKKPVIDDKIDDDNFDDDNFDDLTLSQLQILSCVENEGFLKAELMTAKGRIEDLERDLADSSQREQELLVQIEYLSKAPGTPNRHRTLVFSQNSPQVRIFSSHVSQGMFIEVLTCFRLRISPMLLLVPRIVIGLLLLVKNRHTFIPPYATKPFRPRPVPLLNMKHSLKTTTWMMSFPRLTLYVET
jgi:hypothetical protein